MPFQRRARQAASSPEILFRQSQHPSADNGVVRHDEEGGGAEHADGIPPARPPEARRNFSGGFGRIAPRQSTDDEFSHQQGSRDDKTRQNENEYEGAAAVRPGEIGKTPDATQADGSTGCCEIKAQFR
jgi:hypothetical protein